MASLGARLLGALLILAPAGAAHADAAGEIRERLLQWTADFNAGSKAAACDLFSKTLIADYRGAPETDYAARCRLLERAIDNPTHRFHYADPLIKEIIVEGDLAVVRIEWTETVTPGDITLIEPGMDIFRKETDGKWRIIRYIAYDEERPPDPARQ